MPYCPKCGCEYRAGFTVCADCGVPLTETVPLPSAHPETAPAQLASALEQSRCEAVRALLTDAGIASYAKAVDALDGARTLYTGKALMGFDLFVAADDLERAQEPAIPSSTLRAAALRGMEDDIAAMEQPDEAQPLESRGMLPVFLLFGALIASLLIMLAMR